MARSKTSFDIFRNSFLKFRDGRILIAERAMQRVGTYKSKFPPNALSNAA
jgi:hypothetical protein